jgi:hypothetical protein
VRCLPQTCRLRGRRRPMRLPNNTSRTTTAQTTRMNPRSPAARRDSPGSGSGATMATGAMITASTAAHHYGPLIIAAAARAAPARQLLPSQGVLLRRVPARDGARQCASSHRSRPHSRPLRDCSDGNDQQGKNPTGDGKRGIASSRDDQP